LEGNKNGTRGHLFYLSW